MTNGEVKESLLVSQASHLIAETITEIERLRAECSTSVVYPDGIGNISIRIKVGDEAVELHVGSPEPRRHSSKQAKQTTMLYKIHKKHLEDAVSITHITDASGAVIPLTVDGNEHAVEIVT